MTEAANQPDDATALDDATGDRAEPEQPAGTPSEAPAERPADEQAADEAGEPAAEEASEEPAAEPEVQEAAAEEPAEEPAAEEPTAEEPAEEPAAEEPTAEEPAEEPAAEEPAAEEPAEEPAAEEPAAEEPAEEPAAQEPADAGSADETPAEPAPEEPAEAVAAPQPGGESDRSPPETSAAPEPGSGIGTPIPSAATTGGLNSGDIVSGVVKTVDRREIELDLGSGRVGVVGSRHWTAGLDVDLAGEVQVGDTVEAAVLVREDHKQRIVLSRSWGRQQKAWDLAESARKTGEIISGTVTDAVAAGLTVDIGIRAFVPASMAGDDDLEALVGTEVECKVTEVNQLKGRCILSRKAALRTRDRQAARKRLTELSPGTTVRARVTKVEDFGALVLAEGNLRGRIRRSELSWFRVRRPGDVVAVGDEVEAVVLHTAPAKLNLDLSLRIGEDPLKAIRPGERHQATVVSLAPFGAFVTVGDGIRGLVPTAELAENPIRHPREVVVPGDSILAEVTKVDRQRRDLEFSVNLAVLVRPSDQA
ncbi:MAG: S1 RNA-binding domain-containing protein [bacterium]|nr:S1 RNA-binding domain-containing protein [bacterium]